MAPSPSAAPTGADVEESELVAAANAVFGALELIGEMPCSHETQQNVLLATRAAHARLAEFGLVREDLLHAQARAEAGGGRQPERHPRSGSVVDLLARRSEQPR